jgi:hypothetical protein
MAKVGIELQASKILDNLLTDCAIVTRPMHLAILTFQNISYNLLHNNSRKLHNRDRRGIAYLNKCDNLFI